MGIHLSEITPLGTLSREETREAARALWAEAGRRPGELGAASINEVLKPFSLTFDEIKAAGWLDPEEVSRRRGVAAGRVTLSDLTGATAHAPDLPRMSFTEATDAAKGVVQRLGTAPAEIDGISIKAVYLFGSAVRDNNSRATIGDLDIAADFGFDARYKDMDPAARIEVAKAKWDGLISQGDERLTLSGANSLTEMAAAQGGTSGKEFHMVKLWQNPAPVAGGFTPDQQARVDALAAESLGTQQRARSIAQAVSSRPTPEQAAALLEGVAARARERLLPFMQDDYNGHYATDADREFAVSRTMKQAAEAPDLSTATLSGYCGHAQHFADAELKSMGLKTHWYTFEKAATGEVAKQYQGNGLAPVSELLNNKSTQNHVALTVEIETTAGTKQYVIDPTFRQFLTADALSPGRLLENSLGSGLEKTGVLELTPERAKNYLAAFANGENPRATAQEAMDFLIAVPDRRQSRGSFPPAEFLDSKSPLPARFQPLLPQDGRALPAGAINGFMRGAADIAPDLDYAKPGTGPAISYDKAKKLIEDALEKFDPALAAAAREVLNDPSRMNVREVPAGEGIMMRVRAGGLRPEDAMDFKQHPAHDALKKEFPVDHNDSARAVVDFQYDGTMKSVIYLAHELGHAVADDMQKKAGHTYRDNPQHMQEMQAYIVQSIVNLGLRDNPDPAIAKAAQQHLNHEISKQVAAYPLAQAAMETLDNLKEGRPTDAPALLEAKLGKNWQAAIDSDPSHEAVFKAMQASGPDAAAKLESAVMRLNDRPTSQLLGLAIADRLQTQDAATKTAVTGAALGSEGPKSMAHVLEVADIKGLENFTQGAVTRLSTPETLKGWYLLRGYSADHDPLGTIMDLPRDEAIAKMNEVHPTRGIGEADEHGKRDQTKYYDLRHAADKWVGDNSTAIKDRDNPIFMALTNDPETVRRHMNSPGNNVLVMPLSDMDPTKLSITFDDSMGNYRTTVLDTKNTGINGEFLPDKSPVHGTVMNVEQFAAAIKAHGTTDATGGPRTIEAQYWGTAPLKAEIHAYDPTLPKPPRPAAAAPPVKPVKLYHGTSEAYLSTILQDGFEPRYMSARERMRTVMEGVAGEGKVSAADVDKMVEQGQRRALEAGNVVYTSPDPAVSRGYALNYRDAGGELSHQVQGIMNAHGQPGRFDGARPVLLELEVDGRALKTEMHDYEVLVRAGKDISVKSVTFAAGDANGYSFEGQPALPPDEALRAIAPEFAAKLQPKRDLDPAQQRILKALDDFTHGSDVTIGRTGTMYVAEATMRNEFGHPEMVRVPDPDFAPQAHERFAKYGFEGIAANYTMPHDLIPTEVNGYVTVLEIREQRGEITKAERDAGFKSLFSDIENANPALKGLDFDRNDPAKVSDVLRGAINGYSPENLQHHVSGNRAADYDTLKRQARSASGIAADIDLAPAALNGIKQEMDRKLTAFDAERKPPETVKPASAPKPDKITAPVVNAPEAPVVKTPEAPKAVAADVKKAATPDSPAHGGVQAKLGRATGRAQIAVDVASGHYGQAATGAATEIALSAKTYEAAVELTSAIKPVAKALGFVGKRIPVIGAVVTAGFVLWEAGSYALDGEYGRATAALGAGAAEAGGNILGFGAGDVAREAVRSTVIAVAGDEYAVNKSGIRQLGEGAIALGSEAATAINSKFASGTPAEKPEEKKVTPTASGNAPRPKTPGM